MRRVVNVLVAAAAVVVMMTSVAAQQAKPAAVGTPQAKPAAAAEPNVWAIDSAHSAANFAVKESCMRRGSAIAAAKKRTSASARAASETRPADLRGHNS